MKEIEKIIRALGLMPPTQKLPSVLVLGDESYYTDEIPNDLNAIRELELMVIEKAGANAYGICLASEVRGFSVLGKPMAQTAIIATADAPTRITAILAALEGE